MVKMNQKVQLRSSTIMLSLLLKKNTYLIIKQACSPIIYHVVKKVHFSAKNPGREELQLMIFLYLSF